MFKKSILVATAFTALAACTGQPENTTEETKEEMTEKTDGFKYKTEQFADLKIIRYQVPSFDKLTVKQKELVYYLSQAALSGRDIIWDQNYRHNLTIRKALENIVANYDGDKESEDWKNFMVYTKRVWFSSGIHHHYSMAKLRPGFSSEYMQSLLDATGTTLEGEAFDVIFNDADAKRVNLDPDKDLIAGSANNFYAPGITAKEVEQFYGDMAKGAGDKPISFGLNSKVVRGEDGKLAEKKWHIGGMYSESIEQIVHWLEKASTVAESEEQKAALDLLIEYYKTGDLKTWDEYNITWVAATNDVVDYINGFIEVYGDAKGYKATYESVIQIKDFDASERMQVVSQNAQWFEDNSSIMDEHKKANVVGVTYKVINVAVESGDASPSTPIGINLPNANWIRANHGSKSVSLGNIVEAYDKSSGKGFINEFGHDDEEKERSIKHGTLASKLHTALHEVIGHASGKLNPGIGTPKETLKSYANTLEEARADLVALYYLMDPKLVELGLMESLEVGKAEYDSYIRNGLMVQLRRLEEGAELEEAHMRNRQLVASWAYEKGQEENVIEFIKRDGNTYLEIHDYEKLKVIFGDLLKEIQRIKSEGDYEAGRALVEGYGVKVDKDIHKEVLERSAKLNSAPYGGFINPMLVPVEENGKIVDVKVEYPDDFTKQMMYYAENYSFLPAVN